MSDLEKNNEEIIENNINNINNEIGLNFKLNDILSKRTDEIYAEIINALIKKKKI